MVDQGRSDQGGTQRSEGTQQSGRRNPADNLSREDRVRGGERSASLQQRDQRGQFAGRKKSDEDRNRGGTGSGGGDQGGNNRAPGGNR